MWECRGTYNVIAGDAVGLAPGAHDEGIVVGEDGDLVDSLGAKLGELGDVLGDVVGGADGGEGTCRLWRSVREPWGKWMLQAAECRMQCRGRGGKWR